MERLPSDILADILSRLPINTILQSKSVCKTWLRLLSGSPFAKRHLSRSPTSLMIQHEVQATKRKLNPGEVLREHPDPGFLSIVQVEDETDRHKIGHDPLLRLDLCRGSAFQKSSLLLVGSVNGWLCLWQYQGMDNTLICNPLTHEYMILPRQQYYRQGYAIIVYGFGYSLLTGEYKVMRIFQGNIPADDGTSFARPSLLEAEVYTLGTGKWRSLGHVPYWLSGFSGPFLNGSVHWFVIDEDSPEGICSFDMETESFQLFPSPPKEENHLPRWNQFGCLGVIRGCLCQCGTVESGLDIWVMKEYGVKKSWTKDFVIRVNEPVVPEWLTYEPVYVIKGLKDGTILFTYKEMSVFSYSQATKEVVDSKKFTHLVNAIEYVPSFVRLGNFELENVHVF